MLRRLLGIGLLLGILLRGPAHGVLRNAAADDLPQTRRIEVILDRGPDQGQSFGTLFEATSADGRLVVGAGFQNAYNTRLRADRHAVQFFVRPTRGSLPAQVTALPRPNDLCGTYLYSRDGVLYATYGGLHRWDETTGAWVAATETGGTDESMRLGRGLLQFGDSRVDYEGRNILPPPDRGSYQMFFYAYGHLCFYHVNRGEGGYRPYLNDEDGFSKLYACPWIPEQDHVDLRRAEVMTLPVVGETTFAWGQLGHQIVTGSNIGGFYVFENGKWRKLLEPNTQVSYQLYSSLQFGDRLLMGQYPTGRLFSYDGQSIQDLPGWPPHLAGVSTSAREAQTTAWYAGRLFVGVWPWGELWDYQPGDERWSLLQRLFSHPELSETVTHPYDTENRGHEVGNLWGQRITSLVPLGNDLFVSTSAKHPCAWEPEKFPFLTPDLWKSYGAVYRVTIPGHLSGSLRWTDGPTTLIFELQQDKLTIWQDGSAIASQGVDGALADLLRMPPRLEAVSWGRGVYGDYGGRSLRPIFPPR